MAMNEQKVSKIRNALEQLDPVNDTHWTDDGLPRESVVRQLASDQTLSRREIQDARPGFQRYAQSPAAKAATANPEKQEPALDPLTGEPEVAAAEDPTKNTGELMTEDEVRAVLEMRVRDRTQGLADAQQAVRDANAGVVKAQEALRISKGDLTREFPPLTVAQNLKQYLASEQAMRAYNHGHGVTSGAQIDMAMQRSNSRGWRRPARRGQTQSGARAV